MTMNRSHPYSGSRALLLTLSSILLLAACQPKHEIPAMTPEESQVVETLTARLKPRCVGRYLIDLPIDFVLNPITTTKLEGVDITITKRYSNKWQLAGALTIQNNPQYFPEGSVDFVNPTGRTYREGVSTISKYVLKLNGSYDLPWGVMLAGNFNMFQGGARTLTVNGPGNVYGGVNASGAATTISYTTLEFQDRDAYRFDPIKLLDLGVQKVFQFNGGRQRIKLSAANAAGATMGTAPRIGFADRDSTHRQRLISFDRFQFDDVVGRTPPAARVQPILWHTADSRIGEPARERHNRSDSRGRALDGVDANASRNWPTPVSLHASPP